tara:strand:+ start:571 stop:1416 length:846 start_codon:yes stop_codon:yes gene_type:complete
MAISRMQEPRQLYGLGSLVKGVKKAVKGVTKGVKKFAKSDLGKAAGLAALAFGIPGLSGPLGGGLFGRASMFGPATGLFGQQGIAATLSNLSMPSFFSKSTGKDASLKNFGKVFASGSALTALLGAADAGEEDAIAATQDVGALREYLTSYYSNLGYTADQIAENVARDTSEYTSGSGGYADGGRIGYAMGTEDKVKMAAGIEGLPININPKGIKELDLRETGGFIPPVGVKEKADDIPAMLSNNEFVFTADAVKAAGGGSVDKGAQIMYDTMKKLESKVV